ncbi:MAG: hypothetical protein JW783_09195 [Bacteroidales bacterium]|nr:hypothetical protein [Bacteroidales bacterium]MBN2749741.1 hypothetical protein [Bacteroidales bacterium]
MKRSKLFLGLVFVGALSFAACNSAESKNTEEGCCAKETTECATKADSAGCADEHAHEGCDHAKTDSTQVAE